MTTRTPFEALTLLLALLLGPLLVVNGISMAAGYGLLGPSAVTGLLIAGAVLAVGFCILRACRDRGSRRPVGRALLVPVGIAVSAGLGLGFTYIGPEVGADWLADVGLAVAVMGITAAFAQGLAGISD